MYQSLSQRRGSKTSLCLRLAALLVLTLPAAVYATEIQIGFDTPGAPLPLRLSQGSNGWTHGGWSQYFNDLGVEYRRADHWNDLYAPVRRRPDGGLWFDTGALDDALYNATGGYSFNAYPTVDFCPACMDTDFLQNPFEFNRGTVGGSLTPVGTFITSGQSRLPEDMMHGAANEAGLYEMDRKGMVISKAPYQQLQFVTAANHVVLKPTPTTYSILGADRKEIAHGTGIVAQELDGTSLLVLSSPDASGKYSQVDMKGTVMQTFPGPYTGAVFLMKSGLLSYDHDAKGLYLLDKSGKHLIQKLPDNSWFIASLGANPQDRNGRFYAAISLAPAPGVGADHVAVYAFSPSGQLLWKSDPVPLSDLRGLAATPDGAVVLAGAAQLLSLNQTGVLWKADVRGALDFQTLSTQGMQTLTMRTFEDEIDEYDIRTGEPLWRYGEDSDASYWVCKPPKNMDEWQASISYYLKHYNKDLGVGWDRWELWNEPSEHGYFWDGTWQDYASLLEATMKGVEKADPSIIMDAFDGSGNWEAKLIDYCNTHKVRLDAISWHGYLAGDGDYDTLEKRDLDNHNAPLAAYTGGTALHLSNTEWNVHPGHGEDLSHSYTAGFYRAPFQSEMTYLMGRNNAKFTAIFCMVSDMSWPAGWMFTSSKPVGGKSPDAGDTLKIVTPAYNATRLWAMLPKLESPVTNDFVPTAGANGWTFHVNSIAAADPQKGEYGMLVWNYSNNAKSAKDEDVNLTFNFKGESQLFMRHFVVDADHSTYTKDWQHQWLEATESVLKSTAELGKQTVTLKKDSLHAFFFTRDPLKANPGKSITVEAHHPVQFDGSLSTGMPAFYRWDVDATDGVTFPDPEIGMPSRSHLFGVKPILAKGYDKPGTYTVTLRVSADGYHKVTNAATTTVTVVPEKTPPGMPQNLTTNSAKTDHQVFLQWDSLNFAHNPDVASWTVYRKEGTDWKKLASAPSTSYIDSGVTENTPYSYRVTAVDSSGDEGPPSAEVASVFQISKQAPKTPVALKAVNVADDRIKLDWDNDSLADGACVSGFNVYRRTAGSGDWQKLTDPPIFYKRYYDDISNPGMAGRYEYSVTALDSFKNESLKTDAVAPVPK